MADDQKTGDAVEAGAMGASASDQGAPVFQNNSMNEGDTQRVSPSSVAPQATSGTSEELVPPSRRKVVEPLKPSMLEFGSSALATLGMGGAGSPQSQKPDEPKTIWDRVPHSSAPVPSKPNVVPVQAPIAPPPIRPAPNLEVPQEASSQQRISTPPAPSTPSHNPIDDVVFVDEKIVTPTVTPRAPTATTPPTTLQPIAKASPIAPEMRGAFPDRAPKLTGDQFTAAVHGEMTINTSPALPVSIPRVPASALKPTAAQPMQNDESFKQSIADILGSTKLPERREVRLDSELRPVAKKEGVDVSTSIGVHPEFEDKDAPHEKMTAAQIGLTPLTNTMPNGQKKVVASHTLKDDLQSIVKDKKMSLVRAAVLQSEKTRLQEPTIEDVQSRKAKRRHVVGIVVMIAFFFSLGVLALSAVALVMSQHATPIGYSDQSMIFAEQTLAFPLKNQTPVELKRTLAQAKSTTAITLGAITRIVPLVEASSSDPQIAKVERPATGSEFISALGAGVPDDLIRSLSDPLFLGIHAADRNAPLLILTTNNYERAFAAMLDWEKDMSSGLSPLFPYVNKTLTANENGIIASGFEDIIIQNYDVRVVRGADGVVQLLYAFPTRNILIIAESPHTFVEALSRLQAQRLLQ